MKRVGFGLMLLISFLLSGILSEKAWSDYYLMANRVTYQVHSLEKRKIELHNPLDDSEKIYIVRDTLIITFSENLFGDEDVIRQPQNGIDNDQATITLAQKTTDQQLFANVMVNFLHNNLTIIYDEGPTTAIQEEQIAWLLRNIEKDFKISLARR